MIRTDVPVPNAPVRRFAMDSYLALRSIHWPIDSHDNHFRLEQMWTYLSSSYMDMWF